MRQFNQEELVEKIRSERRHMDELYDEIKKLKQENANLKDYVKSLKDECISCPENKKNIKQAKIGVLNELKKKTHNYYPSIDSYCISQHVVLVKDIDGLIKEAQNGEDKS